MTEQPKLPALPTGQGREELSAFPGLGNRDFTAAQMHAYALQAVKEDRERMARIVKWARAGDATYGEDPVRADAVKLACDFIAAAIKNTPLPKE